MIFPSLASLQLTEIMSAAGEASPGVLFRRMDPSALEYTEII